MVGITSKHWLPIKPATDLALLLAWINVLITEEWYDKDYVERYTYGFDQLKNHVKSFTPEWAYGITTLAPEQIRETAKEMANASPAVIVHPGRHVTWYGDDTQRLRAVAILNALLGSWGRKGGFYNPEKKSIPSWPHPEFPKPKRTWRDAHPGKYNLALEVVSNEICDSTIPSPDAACNFKGWIVNGTNLIFTLPNKKNTLEAIKNLEFMVVIDTMPMEITGYADVVLPEKVGLRERSAEGVLIQDDGTPVVAHVGAQVAREAEFLDRLHAFHGERFVEGDRRGVGFRGQGRDVATQTCRHGAHAPSASSPADAALVFDVAVARIVLLADLLGFLPAL